jgi:hypothetical protein
VAAIRHEHEQAPEQVSPAPAEPVAAPLASKVGNAAFARYVARQRALQRQTPPAAPAATSLTDKLIAALEITGPVNFDAVIADIHAAPGAERRTALENARVRNLIRDRLSPDGARSAMSSLLEGAQSWKNPASNDFYTYFVTTRGTGRLPSTATMNCWEMILYSSYMVGQIDQPWIERFYTEAFADPDPNLWIWRRLGWNSGLPRYPATTPRAGQLLFYQTGGAHPGHVALALGGDQAISLWNQPNGSLATQRIRVDELSGVVTIADAPW